MTEETLTRLMPLYENVIKVLCAMSGTETYEDAIAFLRPQFQDKSTSPAHWLHQLARQIYPTNPTDTVNPDSFFEILGLIDTKEKAIAVLAQLPEENAPEIEKFLKFVVRDFFPNARSSADNLKKKLPQRRSGGPKPKRPNAEKCRAICDEITRLERQGVKRGLAQERLAQKTGFSLRMIQRIFADRDKY